MTIEENKLSELNNVIIESLEILSKADPNDKFKFSELLAEIKSFNINQSAEPQGDTLRPHTKGNPTFTAEEKAAALHQHLEILKDDLRKLFRALRRTWRFNKRVEKCIKVVDKKIFSSGWFKTKGKKPKEISNNDWREVANSLREAMVVDGKEKDYDLFIQKIIKEINDEYDSFSWRIENDVTHKRVFGKKWKNFYKKFMKNMEKRKDLKNLGILNNLLALKVNHLAEYLRGLENYAGKFSNDNNWSQDKERYALFCENYLKDFKPTAKAIEQLILGIEVDDKKLAGWTKHLEHDIPETGEDNLIHQVHNINNKK
jgi:hypothetical protein